MMNKYSSIQIKSILLFFSLISCFNSWAVIAVTSIEGELTFEDVSKATKALARLHDESLYAEFIADLTHLIEAYKATLQITRDNFKQINILSTNEDKIDLFFIKRDLRMLEDRIEVLNRKRDYLLSKRNALIMQKLR